MNRAGSISTCGKVQTTFVSCIQNVVQHREPPQRVQPCSAPRHFAQLGPGTQQGEQQQRCTSNVLCRHQTGPTLMSFGSFE